MPAHEEAQFGKAVALQSLGHPDEASEIYQKILERNPGLRGVALQPDSDRHGEGRFRHGARILRAPAGTASGIHRGAGRAGRVGVRGGRARAHREVLHAAGERRAGPFRRLVQPGAGASEIGALRAGGRSVRGVHQAARAILRSAHQSGHRARAAGRSRRARARPTSAP